MRKLVNLGCKVNQYEGFCLLDQFSGIDELIIINTCCVTQEAEHKSLKKFRQAIKKYPGHIIIASGCLCQLHPEKFSRAQVIIDNVVRNRLIKRTLPSIDKARYLLKIQDGCNQECSFCIVSKLRRDIESKPTSEIKSEITQAQSQGFKEIVLVGANIGLYGYDINLNLSELIGEMSRIPVLPRIRLSSLEPRFINKKLVNLLKQIPFCRHFHIPIQSADDNVLKMMNRRYDRAYLQQTIELISKNFSDLAIGADVIVGFPNEGEKEFLNTYNFIKENPFTHLHIFPYSPRPGTTAYQWGDPVPQKEKSIRYQALKRLIDQKNFWFRKGLLNKEFEIIIDKNRNHPSGLTDNYIRVTIKESSSKNRLIKIRITEVLNEQTIGIVKDE